MSDELDNASKFALSRLMRCYRRLVDTCSRLPLPIALPEARDTRWTDRVAAVARVAEIGYEVPAPVEVQDSLKCCCLQWSAAADLLMVHISEPKQYRVEAATLCVIAADGYLDDIGAWLRKEGRDS